MIDLIFTLQSEILKVLESKFLYLTKPLVKLLFPYTHRKILFYWQEKWLFNLFCSF